MTFTYTGTPGNSDVETIRFEISDTNAAAPLLADGEIAWAITSETGQTAGSPASLALPDLYRSAARCMETLARRFSAQADSQIGSLKVTYSKTADGYTKRAAELRAKAQALGGAPYAGGQSISEKDAWRSDSDSPQPFFSRREYDNPWTGQTDDGLTDVDFGPPTG